MPTSREDTDHETSQPQGAQRNVDIEEISRRSPTVLSMASDIGLSEQDLDEVTQTYYSTLLQQVSTSDRFKKEEDIDDVLASPAEETSKSIYIGKKPLMTYVTSTLIQLANQPSIVIKARGVAAQRAVNVSQMILQRMQTTGYRIGDVRIGTETIQPHGNNPRSIPTIEITISKTSS